MIRYGNKIRPESAFNLEGGLHLPIHYSDNYQHVSDDRVDTDHMPVFNFSEDDFSAYWTAAIQNDVPQKLQSNPV